MNTLTCNQLILLLGLYKGMVGDYHRDDLRLLFFMKLIKGKKQLNPIMKENPEKDFVLTKEGIKRVKFALFDL